MLDVRPATQADVPALVALLEAYMRETYARPWSGTAEALARDGFGARCRLTVAARAGELVAFAAWSDAYDLHHCVAGCDLIDLFVQRDQRGRGVALRLVAALAAEARTRGATYVKGLAVGAPATRAFYERLAMAFDGADCIVGGRAFRVLAELDGKTPREMLRGLPRKEWNYEP
jgi:GNAT superfamily N-acetyltransferase